ncbi:Tuberous sclerosis 1 protein-like protein [Lachnellula subtilissima]|uniref:Tuberous sclerosis 1 protein-like protein n=1 Tax=Lachnellula subtilissima TaxID=602034 RepID=A0A8H8S2N7_9HELO|nr:Tuberous sclerosis 1 protein-like protein [Lachnellula subtilissima]
MSSGSFKDLSKAINSLISKPFLPLPDDLVELIHAYLEKHDASDSQRLQEELLNTYDSYILDKPSRFATFLAILRTLKPALRGNGRILQWWDKLSTPVLSKLGQEKGLAVETRDTLLEILAYDEDDPEIEDARLTSNVIAHRLVETWLEKSRFASEEMDNHDRFVQEQVQSILLAFGKKRPQDFLNTINKYLVDKDNRILALALLSEFIRYQPPHLHLILQTPLFENLLRCLQTDTSTRVITLAMTVLIMLLPHIPSSMSRYLPPLFNIYSRMLFWDRERRSPQMEIHDSSDEKDEPAQQPVEADKSWDKLSYLLESDDETVPELLHYFTFLYGLYPLNFMSYIRKPQRYLRHANFPGADDLDIEPTEIRQRTEPFRQVHLMHPNFFTMTIESELKDHNRWMPIEAADVVAECMALYNPTEDHPMYASRSRGIARKADPNSDIPEQSLLANEDDTPFQSRHHSWRNTQSTAVASADGFRGSGLHRKLSEASQSMLSIADSQSMHASERLDSPTLPAMLTSPSHNQLHDLLNGAKPARTSFYQALTNDSVASLALSNNNHDSSIHVDAYLASLSRDTIPRSPGLQPANADPSLKVAYLHREIQLLRNDLNFERYLKQQHLSHIGQLRTKQIREARVEAETQNLINGNRVLKSKLEEAKRWNMQIKKETEKSKTHSRNWESDLTAKLKVLREEQKKWHLVINSEARELSSRQKIQIVEASLDELERLRGQVEKLTLSVRTYEAGETKAVEAKEGEEAALRRVSELELQLKAHDKAHQEARLAFEREIEALQPKDEEEKWQRRKDGITQEMLDSAMENSRSQVSAIHKAHSHLLKRFTTLQSAYMDLREIQDSGADEALLSQGFQATKAGLGQPSYGISKSHTFTDSDAEGSSSNPPRKKAVNSFGSKGSESRSTGYHFQSPQPYKPGKTNTSDGDTISLDTLGNVKPKIKPQSEIRVYGRGGVQNIGKKEKDKKDKEKAKDPVKDNTDAKKDKKSAGIRGIRGFV